MKRIVCGLILLVSFITWAVAQDDTERDIQGLGASDAKARAAAAARLGQGCGCGALVKAVPPLTEALKDSDPYVRKSAALSLGSFRTSADKSIPLLIVALSDPDEGVRQAAIAALGALGAGKSQVEDALKPFLADPDPLTKHKATLAFARMGKPEHIDPAALISALHTRDPEETKAAISALEVLANQSPEKIIPPLVDEIARAEDPFTGAALRVLRKTRKQSGKYAPQLAAHFQKLPPLHKVGMLQTIQEIDPEGPRLQELISEAFKDPDPLVRKEAVQAMTRNRERMQGYRDSILAALKDENVDVRIAALRIVTAYVELLAGAESRLLELTKDPDEQMRLHATANIGLLRTLPPESLDTLAAALKDKEPKVRMAAVMSLHNLALRKKANSAPILEAAAKTEEDYRTKEYLQNVLEDLGVRKRIRETAQPSGPPAPPAGHGMPPGFELNRE